MKYLASDIDGTLVKHNGKDQTRSILDEDIRALKQWTKENYLIISTGRNSLSTFHLFDYYNLNLKNTFYMSSNGAEVFDENRNCIYRCHLPLDKSKQALTVIEQLMKQYAILTTIYNGKEVILLETVEDIKKLNTDDVIVNICVESKNQNILDAKVCLEALRNSVKDVEIHMNNWYVDIVPCGISKASAIQWITNQKMKDINPYIIAIGDSYNDINMFEIANSSYTFNLSQDEVKNKAHHLVNHVYECISKEK